MKVRRIDYSADEMLAGVSGQMTPEEFGVYWMVCTLIYSSGDAIEADVASIAARFRKTNPRTVRAILGRLVDMRKIQRNDAELMVKRCRTELEKASERTRKARQNGTNGGRPPKKNKGLEKPGGFGDEKLTINYQPSTTNPPSVGDARAREAPTPKSSRRKAGVPLPEGWQPDRTHARAKGMNDATIEHEASQFRDHHLKCDSRFRDWSAAWRTWCGNWVNFGRKQIDGGTGLSASRLKELQIFGALPDGSDITD